MQQHIKMKNGRKIPLNTDEEDAAITRQAIEDGTNWTDDELNQFMPASEVPELQSLIKANRGRPKAAKTKKAISIRLSDEVLEYFRGTGKGWQTRLDEVLKLYVKSHQ